MTQRVLSPLVVAAVVAVAPCAVTPTKAADLGGYCCADLEDRVAELEATAARKGNSKVDVKVSGEITTALLFWDDGEESDVYVVTNESSGSSVAIEGKSELQGRGKGWSMGFALEFDLINAGSDEVSQIDAAAALAEERGVVVGDVLYWIKNERLGAVAIGFTSARGKTNGANEADLSETDVASFVNVQDVGGGFLLRRAGVSGTDGLIDVKWDDLIDALDEPDGNIIAYNTPQIAGFSFYGWWGHDERTCFTNCFLWNVGVTYQQEFGELFKVAAGLATNTNIGDDVEELDDKTIVGSISVLHKPSGLNLSFATGRRNFLTAVELNNGAIRTPADPFYYYVKAGWRRKFHELGMTAFYADYGRYQDFLGLETDQEIVGALGGIDEADVCTAPGLACLVSGANTTTWGLGVVQNIGTDELQLYLGYRHYEVDIDLTDVNGQGVSTVPLHDFHAVLAGMKIEF